MLGTDNKEYSSWVVIFIVAVLFVLELANIILMGSMMNLIVAIPEVMIVLYVLYFKNDVQLAFLLHLSFCLTGFDVTSALSEDIFYSYTKVKLVGPLTVSYIILGLIYLKASQKGIAKNVKQTLSYDYYSLSKVLFLYATIVGLIGLVIFDYRLSDFLPRYLYLLIGIIMLSIFLRLYSPSFLKKCYLCVFCLIIASPIASFVSYYLLNISSHYSTFDAFIYNEVFWLAPVLLLALFYYKGQFKVLSFLSLLLYGMCIMAAGRGGQIITIGIAVVIASYLVYFSKEHKKGTIAKIFKIALPISIIGAITYFSSLDVTENLATIKFNEMMSLLKAFSLFGGSGMDLSSISDSPYTRIAEVCNIVDNGLHNPLGLIFGKGYGGTFTDSTGMFEGIDLSDGGYPIEVIESGRFGTPHSAVPNILLYHGVIGLVLIIRLTVKYVKKITYTPVVFAAVILFLLSFYFNTNQVIALSFALCAAEYKIQYTHPYNTI